MNELHGFSTDAVRAYYRPTGSVSFEELVDLITAAIERTDANHLRELLVDTTALAGFSSPALARRFFAIEEWARAARGIVRIAIVARPEMIDEHKFGVTVGVNRRLKNNIF